MITLITGTPGAGKTLYAITKLLQPLVGQVITRTTDDGIQEELPRTVYTNINGLLLDHEPIGPGGDWSQDPKKAWHFTPIGEGRGLRDWHQWAKPGSVIVYDEFQKVWPPAPNGSPIPPDLQALDTHRHMGVDFILITQSPNNHHRHIGGLVGRHLHVRRMGNLALTIVYEWDHCSRQLLYSKSLAKSPWRYDKKVFKLYKSADAHTKQPRRIPTLAIVVIAALIGAAYMIPTFASRLSERAGQTASAQVEQDRAAPGASAVGTIEPFNFMAFIPRVSNQPNSAPAYDEIRKVVSMPRIAGAICNSRGCTCYTEQATNAGMSDSDCLAWMENRPYDAYTASAGPAQPMPVDPQQVKPSEASAGIDPVLVVERVPVITYR